MSNSPNYLVYTDGSYMNHGCEKSGVGFVIIDPMGNQISEGSLKLGNANSSSLAEIYAAVIALRSIEAPSLIALYSDDKTLCETIKYNKFDERIYYSQQRLHLKTAYEDLKRIVNFHFKVAAQYIPRNSTPQMEQAHKLAQEGVSHSIQMIFTSP